MANNVFANGRELSCKSGSGKSIAAFPDVCMTPPENPATPPGVPVPYPNTGMASDTTSGSRTVKITGKEVMLKNKSYFKKSSGDEAGSAAKKGVVSSVNRGKVYFTAWSMDVKIEGENAVRHLDMTTHNHGSPGNGPPWPFIDTMAILQGAEDPCADERERADEACEGLNVEDQCTIAGLGKGPVASGMRGSINVGVSTAGIVDLSGNLMTSHVGSVPEGMAADNQAQNDAWQRAQRDPCLAAMRCSLSPYDKDKKTCCPGQTPHHLIDGTFARGASGATYNKSIHKAAPCVCAEGTSNVCGSHGMLHAETKQVAIERHGTSSSVTTTYGQQKQEACDAMQKVFPASDCSEKCIGAQLDNYYSKHGFNNDTQMTGNPSGPAEDTLDAKIEMNAARRRCVAAQG